MGPINYEKEDDILVLILKQTALPAFPSKMFLFHVLVPCSCSMFLFHVLVPYSCSMCIGLLKINVEY